MPAMLFSVCIAFTLYRSSTSPGLKGTFFPKRIFLRGATNTHTGNISGTSKTRRDDIKLKTANTTLWNGECDSSNNNASTTLNKKIGIRGGCRTKGLKTDLVLHDTHYKGKTVKQLDGLPTKRSPKPARGPLRRSKRLASTVSKDGRGNNYIESSTQMKTSEMKETMSNITTDFTNVKLRKRVLPDTVMQEYEFNDNVDKGSQSKQTAHGKTQNEETTQPHDAKGLSKSTGIRKVSQAERTGKKQPSKRAGRSSNNFIPAEKIMSKMKNFPGRTGGPKGFKRINVGHKYPRRRSSRIQAAVPPGETIKSGADLQGKKQNHFTRRFWMNDLIVVVLVMTSLHEKCKC